MVKGDTIPRCMFCSNHLFSSSILNQNKIINKQDKEIKGASEFANGNQIERTTRNKQDKIQREVGKWVGFTNATNFNLTIICESNRRQRVQ